MGTNIQIQVCSLSSSHFASASTSSTGKDQESTDLNNTNWKQKISSANEDESHLKHTNVGGRHFVLCIPCSLYPDIVKFFTTCKNKKLPAITQEPGTRYRVETVSEHFKTGYHEQAVKKHRLSTLTLPDKLHVSSSEIVKSISKQNEELANKIGKLLLHVYCDAKKLTLSAWSFPVRVFVGHLGNNFSFNAEESITKKIENFNFQYITPASHLELLKNIVNTHRNAFLKNLLDNSLAISLRCDGSVDRTQLDKIYVMAKCVTKDGDAKTFFLGAAEPQNNGAEGVLEAVKTACNNISNSPNAASRIFNAASSFVTDGAPVNTGQKNGLWTLLKREKASRTAFVTIWCSVHRSNLVWKHVTKNIKEVDHMVKNLSSISSFFHESAVRTRELKEIAQENNLKVVHFPKYFEIRWTEFISKLINSVLMSWVALVSYSKKFQKTHKECGGYYIFLTSEENLKMMCHLADVLSVFSHYQKSIQSDSTTLLDVQNYTESVKGRLDRLKKTPLTGGWASFLIENLVTEIVPTLAEGDVGGDATIPKKKLHGIHLEPMQKRRKQAHLFVTDKRSANSIINDTIESFKNFLDEQFSIDSPIANVTKSFAQLQADADLKKVHKIWAPDLNLETLGCQYLDILEFQDVDLLRKKELQDLVKHLATNPNFNVIATILARIVAAKPHSADVERLISSNNLLKTSLRSSLNLETENLYLFVHHNMPVLAEWDPRPTIMNWFKDRERRAKETPKAKEQSWYKHVFQEATGEEDEADNDQEYPKKSFGLPQ